jgi:hypothetical protein
MPWCDACAKYWNPPSLTPEGCCPQCGRALGDQLEHHTRAADDDDERLLPRAPWHFKVLLGGMAIYLGYRVYQGIAWLLAHVKF